MKAIVYSRYGSPDELQMEEVEKPTPAVGEVLVKVHSASINSWDDYKRALKPGGIFSMIGGSMRGLLLQLMVMGPVMSSFGSRKLGIMGYRPNRKDLDLLSRLCEDSIVVPVIDKSYPLAEVPEAFRYFGTGKVRGKIMISV